MRNCSMSSYGRCTRALTKSQLAVLLTRFNSSCCCIGCGRTHARVMCGLIEANWRTDSRRTGRFSSGVSWNAPPSMPS
jgi:hypothetical protein